VSRECTNRGDARSSVRGTGHLAATCDSPEQPAGQRKPNFVCYDPWGRRASWTNGSSGGLTFLYDGANVAQATGSGSYAQYSDTLVEGLGLDQLIGIAQGGNPLQWALHDGMGSTAYMEAANGSITANYQYTPTGQTFLASGGLQGWPFLFTGRDIGLDQNYYNRNRYYDATLDRFMSPDPLSFGGGDTNLYAYVRNSPTNLVDPLGLSGGSSGGDLAPLPPNAKQLCGGDCNFPTAWAEATTITAVGGGTIHVGRIATPSPTATTTPTPTPTPTPGLTIRDKIFILFLQHILGPQRAKRIFTYLRGRIFPMACQRRASRRIPMTLSARCSEKRKGPSLEASARGVDQVQDGQMARIAVYGPLTKSLALLIPWCFLDLWIRPIFSPDQVMLPVVLLAVFTACSFSGFWCASAAGFEAAPLMADFFVGRLGVPHLVRIGKSVVLVAVTAALVDTTIYVALRHVGGRIESGTVSITGSELRDAGLFLDGAIGEEIVFRLFLMGGSIALLRRWRPRRSTAPLDFWAANLFQAVAFGAAHVWDGDTTFKSLPWWLLPFGVGQAWVGIAFGYSFFFYGIEATILAHALIDFLTELLFLSVSPSRPQPLLLAWRLVAQLLVS
jgi:RHS repeat-associated protein